MRAVIMCVAFLLTAPAWAQKEPCTTQNYDKDAEPRLDCPGPEEEALVRPGKHKASKSLKAGARAPRAKRCRRRHPLPRLAPDDGSLCWSRGSGGHSCRRCSEQ